MTNVVIVPKKCGKFALKALSALALIAIMGTATISPAKADWDNHPGHPPTWHERGWDRHAHDAYRWHHAHPHYEPHYVSSPPPVVYYPPQSTGINLILPLHFN